MKTKLLSIALIGLLTSIMVNCSKDDTVKSEAQQEMVLSPLADYNFIGYPPATMFRKAGKAVTKTIKFFEVTGPFEFDYTVDGCAPFPYLTIYGEGNASHIGRYTVQDVGCYDGESPIFGSITAANGDEIHTYVASAVQDLDTGIWTYHYIIYEGTGQFDGVYGNIYLLGTIDFENFTWTMWGEGEITY
jgi:hypothetical protein